MASILTLRGTGDWGTDERPKNFRESILWLDPNGNAPLTALLSKARSESTDDPEFSWWTEKLQAVRTGVSAILANNAASVTITLTTTLSTTTNNWAQGNDLVPGDILMVEPAATATLTQQEYMIVTAISSNTQIVVTRAALSSTIQTVNTSTVLIKVGNAYEEGSTSPTATHRNPTKATNWCQIFKTAYSITETAKRTKARTGDPLKNDKKRRMFDHSVALEMAFLLGRIPESTITTDANVGSGGKPLRYTKGLIPLLVDAGRVTVFGATATESTFLTAIQDVFDYSTAQSGSERLILAGNSFMMALNQLVKASGQIQFDKTVTYYGMNLNRYITPVGDFYFRRHPLFNQSIPLQKTGVILDMSAIKYRYLRDTTAQDNIQANDADLQKGQWLTEAGLELTTNVTSKVIQNLYYP